MDVFSTIGEHFDSTIDEHFDIYAIFKQDKKAFQCYVINLRFRALSLEKINPYILLEQVPFIALESYNT